MKFDPSQHAKHIIPPEVSLADVTDEKTRKGCMQIYDCIMEIMADMHDNPDNWPEGCTLLSHNGFWKLASLGEDKYIKFGFAYDTETDTLANSRYPLFCETYTEFLHLYKKRMSNMGGYVNNLDFRLFAKRVKLTFDDFLRPLHDAERKRFMELREYAMSKGMKEEAANTGYFRYYCGKKQYANRCLELFNNSWPHFTPHASVKYSDFEQFLEIAESQPDADVLVEYIIDNFNFCDDCAVNSSSKSRRAKGEKKKCGYHYVQIRDKKRLSCAARKITTWKFSKQRPMNDADVSMLKRMMDIRLLAT